jgi:hypothetical protein
VATDGVVADPVVSGIARNIDIAMDWRAIDEATGGVIGADDVAKDGDCCKFDLVCTVLNDSCGDTRCGLTAISLRLAMPPRFRIPSS